MWDLQKFCFIINFQYILVECFIQTLNVRAIDRKVISQKRQDTMDMCRIFTEENEKTKYPLFTPNNAHPEFKKHRRNKRSFVGDAVNPALNAEEAKRVESIVDKLYDDMQEKGEHVTYRQQNVDLTTVKNSPMSNKTSRRFNFAPAQLLPPVPKEDEHETTKLVTTYEGKRPRFPLGIVPYYIDSKTYDAHLSELIMNAFDYFEKATCIRLQRLRERPTDAESLNNVVWLYITNPSGIRQCVHSNERHVQDGVQMIVFGYDCMSLGDIAHEVMHILGFSHEHTRSDRDRYVSIFWDNIKPGYKKYFEIYENNIVESLPYDYASVLHYPPRAFSKNGQVTILTQPGIKIGQREGLSEIDVEKITVIYSGECVKRNREYLLKTCPSVVKSDPRKTNVTREEVEDYFKNRIWPYGIINYKLRDKMEFSTEERENIKTVIRHIEKETCIEFQDLTTYNKEDESDNDAKSNKSHLLFDNSYTKYKQEIKDSENEAKQNEDITIEATETDKNENSGAESPNEKQLKQYIDERQSENEIKNTDDDINDTYKGNSNSDVATDGDDEVAKLRKGVDVKNNKTFRNIKTASRQAAHSIKSVPIKSATTKGKRVRRAAGVPLYPTRKHASDILILSRSAEPGCICPEPGRPKGNKVLTINADCFNSVNDLLHLFVHVLGLDHQHNMYDRDSYLHIVWDQLVPDIKEEMKNVLPAAASIGFAYDYQSVMHYPWLQIKNGVTNIMYPIWNDGWAMGHWQGLSSTDVQKLNLLYYEQCTERLKESIPDKMNMKFKRPYSLHKSI